MMEIDHGLRQPRTGPLPLVRSRARDSLQDIRLGYLGLVVLAAAIQLVVFQNFEGNFLSTALALVSSLVGISYALSQERFHKGPISALILLFYTTTSTSGALLVKTLEWAPVAERLLVPVETFGVLLATQVLLLVADRFYLKTPALQTFRRFLGFRVLQRSGVIAWPSDAEFWMLGLVGCASVLMTGTDFESGVSFGAGSAGSKLFRAFSFLKFAPFLIPFRSALGGYPVRAGLPVVKLCLYFVGLIAVSFATNSRSTFADAMPTIGICILLAQALGGIELRRIPPMRLLVIALAAAAVGVLLSRVALAMVVARDFRYGVDVFTLIRTTAEALFNDEWLAIAKSKMDNSINVGDYSESYVNSRFLARFLLTKFHDNILYYLGLFGDDHLHAYRQFMADRLAATLPDPLLRLFGFNIDKQDLVVSNGDYIVYVIDGWGLGGFKTGSMIAESFGVFGWAYPLVIVGSGLMLFVFYDAFVVPTRWGRLAFSPLILLLIWNLVGTTAAFGLGAETVTAIPSGIVRGLPQNILVYLIAVTGVKLVGRLIGRR